MCLTRSTPPLAMLLLMVAISTGLGQNVAESPVFSLDTRDAVTAAVAESGVFSFDTRLVDGLSGTRDAASFILDTRTLYPQALVITGPATCPVGGRVSFQALAQYAGGSTEDVSAQVVWSASGVALNATGLERAVFSGNHLTAGLATWTEPVLLTASYPYGNGRLKSATYQVTIGASSNALGTGIGLTVANGQYLRPAGGSNYVWQIHAATSGEVQTATGVSYQWYVNGVLTGVTSASYVQEYSGAPGTVTLKVVATDSLGRQGIDTKVFSLQRPALNEPGQKYRAIQPKDAVLQDGSGHLFQFDANRIANGLIVITHGMTDGPNADWIKNLATAIEARLVSEGKPAPNIAIFGWEQGANPMLKDLVSTDPGLAAKILKVDANIIASIPYIGEYLFDFLTIKADSTEYQIALSQWIQDEISRNHINASMPIQFIGHSAGGFVTSGAAYYLKLAGIKVTQVTTLDTPLLERNVVTTLMNNSTKLERYISSALGACVPELGERSSIFGSVWGNFIHPWDQTMVNAIPEGSYYHRQVLSSWFNPIAGPNIPTSDAHNYSHDWYLASTIGPRVEGNGFATSPFMTAQAPAALAPPAFAAISTSDGDGVASAAPTPPALGGFTPFGSVTGSGSPYVLTEDTNAGIQQTMTLPVGADALQFRYQFTSVGDGDFIAVYFGDHPPLFIGPDVAAARTAPLDVNVPLQGYEGQTGTLVIKLVSQGQTNAVAQIDQITLSTVDDPDHDGLTITQEQVLGTNPLLYDTDIDGIGDWEEVNTTLTNPLLADSDSDGLSDAQEILAGTGATNQASNFRATGTTRAISGAVTITWAAKAGKTYRVQRSDSPDFNNYTIVEDNLIGVEPTSSYTDSSVPFGTARAFYRVEVQP